LRGPSSDRGCADWPAAAGTVFGSRDAVSMSGALVGGALMPKGKGIGETPWHKKKDYEDYDDQAAAPVGRRSQERPDDKPAGRRCRRVFCMRGL